MARLAFYRWFDGPLERFMAALEDQALAYARAQQVDLSGILGVVKGWYIVDSTTATVRDALREEFPRAGASAALKVRKVLSVGCGALVHYRFSPAREHDSRHLAIDGAWRGCGLLADLASNAREQLTYGFFPKTDLDVLLAEEALRLGGWAIDADVRVGNTKDPRPSKDSGLSGHIRYQSRVV